MITRRSLVGVAAFAGVLPVTLDLAHAETDQAAIDALAALETAHGGRLGVAVLDAAGRPRAACRGNERFALCSTFKVLAAALVLARVDAGLERLDRRVAYGSEVLLLYAPVTSRHVGDGLTIGQLCDAAVTLSDNSAANLLLTSFGGPPALTAWLRTQGDAFTRLDNPEPTLNDVPPGEVHDTTTPLAMAATLHRLFTGAVLSEAGRSQLAAWMEGCRTGDHKIRAGVPAGWRVGDKTGSFRTTTNDVAALWPSAGRAPRIVTGYYVGGNGSDADRDAVLAEVGRIAAGV